MTLADARGIVLDLDGCVWNGAEATPGARELIAALRRAGRGVAFLSNNSRATGRDIHARLEALGIEADPNRVLTPLEIVGEFIRERHGVSRVLVIGADEMATVIRASSAVGYKLATASRVSPANLIRATATTPTVSESTP